MADEKLLDLKFLLGGKDAIATLGTFAYFLQAYAKEETLKQMNFDTDFILAIDAPSPKKDEAQVVIMKGEDGAKKIHVLRYSSKQKYKNIYEEILYAKMEEIIKGEIK